MSNELVTGEPGEALSHLGLDCFFNYLMNYPAERLADFPHIRLCFIIMFSGPL